MRCKPLVLAALLASGVEPLGAQEAVAPTLPPGVAPLPADLAARVEELLHAAEKIRGLQAKRPVLSGVVDEKDLPVKVAETMREEMSGEQLRAAGAALKTFGLLPESLDLARYFPALLASQVAGYYDPERGYLTMVHRGGDGLGKEVEEMVLVHELTHALQDQAFDLKRFVQGDPLSDEATAQAALVEGDASLVMFDFYTQSGAAASGAEPDPLGAREMAAAPAWLRETLEFAYVEGYAFCLSVRRKGGQKLLDAAFRDDPPRSSEQILHPEKWHTQRDDPVALAWPDLARRLPGARKLAEGQLGELGIGILLRESTAAAGWGGDRFAVYADGDRRMLAWITEWDSAADAREFRAAARRLGRDWTVEAVAPTRPTRILVLRGPWKRSERKMLRGVLADVRAVK